MTIFRAFEPASTKVNGRGDRLSRILLQAALLIAVTLACFWPALRGGWLWDDDLEIVRSPFIRAAGGWWKPWVSPAGMDYFPLKDTLHWFQWRLWGDAVLGYHVSNVCLHLLSALLLWRLLDKLGAPQAWLGGLLFAVHPVAVESVAWISEFKNTASFPPLLLGLGAWVDYDERRRPRDLWLALAWFVVAMLCKTSVVMLPFFLLLLAWWRRRRIGLSDLLAAAPFFAVSLVLGLVTLRFQGHRAMIDAGPAAGFIARFDQAGWNLLFYLRTFLWPVRLSPIYEPFQATLPGLVPWLFVAAALVGCWLCRAGWGRHALLGGGWFVLNLIPILGLVPLSYLRVAPRADHFAYLSLAGITALAGAGFAAAWDAVSSQLRVRRLILALAGTMLVVAFAVLSRAHAAIFRDESVLWHEAVARSPNAWLAHNNLGRVLMGEGSPSLAREQFEAALRLGPDSAEVQTNLGNALEALNLAPAAQAHYEAAVKIDPAFAGAHYGLGRSLLRSGHPAEAAAELQRTVTLDPSHAFAHNNLGLALAQLGHLPDALVEYQKALQLNPRLPEVYLNLGNAHARAGEVEAAIAEYRKALELDPRYAAAQLNLAATLHALGRDPESQAEAHAARNAGGP